MTPYDLIAFLNVRLDKDEASAPNQPDPARALREVAAKRRIVDDYRITVTAVRNVTGADLDTPGYHSMRGGRDALESCVRLLAAVFDDQPVPAGT